MPFSPPDTDEIIQPASATTWTPPADDEIVQAAPKASGPALEDLFPASTSPTPEQFKALLKRDQLRGASQISPIDNFISPAVVQKVADAGISKLPKKFQPAAKIVAALPVAVDKTIAGVLDWMTSPAGAEQLAAYEIPVTKIPTAIKFFHDMAKGGAENLSGVVDAWKSGDPQAIADSVVGTIANFGGASLLGLHTASPLAKAKILNAADKHEETISGATLKTPAGAQPPPETQGPAHAEFIVPPDMARPGVPTQGIPFKGVPEPVTPKAPKVTVPGTAAEPYETALQTIRKANAMTVAQIQNLFPKAGLTREGARELRNQAWGKPATESEKPNATNPQQQQTGGEQERIGIAPQRIPAETSGGDSTVRTAPQPQQKIVQEPPAPARPSAPASVASDEVKKANLRIDELVSIGEARRKNATLENQGLRPSPVDWLSEKEQSELHDLQTQLPSAGQLRAEAQSRLEAKRLIPLGPTKTVEENVPAAQKKFFGSLEPGETFGTKTVLGNFDRKKDADELATKTGGTREGYLNGKHKRGWVVFGDENKTAAPAEPPPAAAASVAGDEVKPVATETQRTSSTGEPEQFNLFEAPKEKPADAQIIQLRRMLETSDRLYGENAANPRAKAIAKKLGPLEQQKLRARFGSAGPVEPTPIVPEKPSLQPTAPKNVTTETEPAREDKPVLPKSPIPKAGEPVKTFSRSNVESKADTLQPAPPLRVQKQFLADAVSQAIKEFKPPKWTPAQKKLVKEGKELSSIFDRLNNRKRFNRPSKDELASINEKANEWTAKMKAELPYVVFDVPGDGTFSVLHSLDALSKFRDMVKKEFPSGALTKRGPGNARITATPVPVLVENPDVAGIVKAIGSHASQDETRASLFDSIYSNGKEIVTTDGRRMVRVIAKGPGSPTNPARIDVKTGKAEPWDEKMSGTYPEYNQVVPSKVHFVGTADTEELWRNILRAELIASERANSINLYRNPDNTFGTASHSPDVGESAHNVQNGAQKVGSFYPIYLLEAMETARKLGNEKVDLYSHDTLTPLVIRGKNHDEILMPMRNGDESIGDGVKPSKAIPLHSEPLPPHMDTKWKGKRLEANLSNAEMKLADLKEKLAREDRAHRREFLNEEIKNTSEEIKAYKKALAQSKKALPPEPETPTDKAIVEVPETPTEGVVHGFGGVSKIKNSVPVATTAKALNTVQQAMTPGLSGVQSLLLPTARSGEHLTTAENLGAKIGAMNRRAESTAFQLRKDSKTFDKLGVHDEKLEPSQNPGIRFMSDMSQGRPMKPAMQTIADKITKFFEERLQKLEEAGVPLQEVRDNYFPGMWTKESREAYNAALAEAMDKGVITRDADVNAATPQQRAWVKARVDDLIGAGKGSETDMLGYLTRKPLKGKETFRKQKVFDDIMDAAEFGLRPVSANPIDIVKLKLAEVDKSIMANEFLNENRAKGKEKIINPYQDLPQGWVKVNDKYGTIYGKPTVTVPEYIDKQVYDGLLDFAAGLGIRHERSMTFPKGPGNRALGLSYQGAKFIRSRFGTETSIIAHEIGHQLDVMYGLWNKIVTEATGTGARGTVTKAASQKQRGKINKELRAIADMTGNRGGEVYSKDEKLAQMVEAYVHSPEAMLREAPNVFAAFDTFIKSKPELKGLADIKPGIELKKLTGEKYVGLPILGYRIVPEAVGDIVNNYLSSSLYNNKYFGGLYKGWMGTANTLNQSQLGLGSAFHAGFTTMDVQISAGANLIKDLYGVARGNRSASDLLNTAKTFSTAAVQTGFTGDKVLNAWRNPDGVIDPRIAQVVRAAELGGGGFKMEHGLQTEQVTKLLRDWYSGKRAKAALRSPVALTELMAKPIMEFLVPRQKAGVFAELAWRLIDMNPGKDLEDLTPAFRQAWNRVDARLGQVRYNRLFLDNMAKEVMQGLVRAPGWTGGTIAEIGGAFPDAAAFAKEWMDTGKLPANIPDRVAYTLSLLATVAVVNGTLTYLFTGQQPRGMDYFAFRSGKKDKDGNEQRYLLPTYVKDILAYSRQPLTTVLHKTHPLLSMFSDVYHNQDFYGYEIRDPHASKTTQAGQVAKYVVSQFEPFWTRGVRKASQAGASAGSIAAPYVGVMPAPAYITRTPLQNEISELYHQRTGERLKPYDSRATDAGKKPVHDPATMDIYMFHRLPKTDQDALRAKMSPAEQKRYGSVSAQTILGE